MGSRHMIYWRVFVYAHNLYSISGSDSLSYRDCSPNSLRRQPNELHRILDFANRDLSVLIRHSEMELMHVFEVLQDLLLELNMRSVKFREALTPHLSLATPQFIHELYNFARSPYDELISYDCNVKYRAMELREEEKFEGSDAEFLLLPGIQSFADFSRLVDNDECIGFNMDFDVEDEDPKMMDEYYNLSELSAPMLDELRRMLSDRRARRQAQNQTQNAASNQSATRAATAISFVSGSGNVAVAGSTGATAAAAGTSSTVTPSDFGLELAVERSMLDRSNNEATPPRRQHRATAARSMPQLAVPAVAAAAAATAAVVPARVAQNYTGTGFGTLLRVSARPRSSNNNSNNNAAPKRRYQS